jgi:hypothetical protein
MIKTTKKLSNKRFFQLVQLEDSLSSTHVAYSKYAKKLITIKNIGAALYYNSKANRCQTLAMKVRNQIRKGNNGIF